MSLWVFGGWEGRLKKNFHFRKLQRGAGSELSVTERNFLFSTFKKFVCVVCVLKVSVCIQQAPPPGKTIQPDEETQRLAG
jgi:hypothetical protein